MVKFFKSVAEESYKSLLTWRLFCLPKIKGEFLIMVETTKKQWYVLHTYSGYEDKVKSDLLSRAQSMGMQDYIFRVMVPEQEKIEKVNNKKKEVEEKIFPGYVLVEMVMTDESWLNISCLFRLTCLAVLLPLSLTMIK